MPIYVFRCKKCGKSKEELQKFDDPSPICEDENHGNMIREIGSPHIRKGGGLYSLDVGEKTPKMKDYKE